MPEFKGDQERGFHEVINLFKSGHKRVRLVGSAGTGKTYLSKELVKFFKQDRTINPNWNNGEIFVTAPTNKALAILMSKITDVNVVFKTIHSALRMRRVTNSKSGQQSFVRSKFYGQDRSENFDMAKMAIIDEASMLESTIEGNGIAEGAPNRIPGHLEDMGFPILYIGDDKQLPPVNEKISPVFTKDYPEVKLKAIIRQGAGNPIIDLSNDLDMLYFKVPKLIDNKGYMFSEDINAIVSDLAEVNGTDDLKYLAYTNKVVDAVNAAVRIKRYGRPARIEREETVVFNSPYGENYTNKEVRVDSVDIVTDYVPVPRMDTRYEGGMAIGLTDKIRMKFYYINNSIKVLHEHSDHIYMSVFNTIKENCTKFGWDWHARDFFKEQFADIKYNHAITIHKSQGSTYKETIINIADVDTNRDVEEKQRLLYTGVTRASDLLILNNVK